MELVGKLTPKSLGWDRNQLGTETAKVPADGGKVLIGRIVGIVAGLRQTINNDTGEVQNGLKGNFRGVSSKVYPEGAEQAGKPITVTSGVCYLPSGIQDMIEGALASAKEADAKATVNFAIDLYGIPATNKAGYSFKAENIVAPQTADPLAMLLEQAEAHKSGAAMLPAPDGEAPATAPSKGGAKGRKEAAEVPAE